MWRDLLRDRRKCRREIAPPRTSAQLAERSRARHPRCDCTSRCRPRMPYEAAVGVAGRAARRARRAADGAVESVVATRVAVEIEAEHLDRLICAERDRLAAGVTARELLAGVGADLAGAIRRFDTVDIAAVPPAVEHGTTVSDGLHRDVGDRRACEGAVADIGGELARRTMLRGGSTAERRASAATAGQAALSRAATCKVGVASLAAATRRSTTAGRGQAQRIDEATAHEERSQSQPKTHHPRRLLHLLRLSIH
jgi:hypothetical protein